MKRIIPLIIGTVVLAGAFFLYRTNSPEDAAPPLLEQETQNITTDSKSGTPSYTLEEVAMHTSEQDCWFVIGDMVYDVTPYIASTKHPGGKAIIEGCGTDATTLFETRPMGSGTPHSDAARNALEQYVIGAYAR